MEGLSGLQAPDGENEWIPNLSHVSAANRNNSRLKDMPT